MNKEAFPCGIDRGENQANTISELKLQVKEKEKQHDILMEHLNSLKNWFQEIDDGRLRFCFYYCCR